MPTWNYESPRDPDTIPDEWVWERLRMRRNADLAASDWTQTADSPVDKAEWAIYRQLLRDLPANTSDPRQAVWPEEPSA